jgi:putative tryptophan/tyrosine transport system substrate-binding protein
MSLGSPSILGTTSSPDKRIQLLKEMVPQATRLAWVETRKLRDQYNASELEQCRKVGLTRVGPALNRPIDQTEYRRLFAALAQEGAEMIAVTEDAENVTNLRLIIELAEKGRLPAVYPYREFVEVGGLMSYGVDFRELGHRAADIANRILKGAKPAEIPVFQPTKFELAINLKTAKALSLTVPHSSLMPTMDNIAADVRKRWLKPKTS